MKKYGFINNLGELKVVQTTLYKGMDKFVGITRNGLAYIHNGNEARQLTKEEVASYLNLTSAQVDSVIRSRGKVDFDVSKENSAPVSNNVKKSMETQHVKAETKDTLKGREMTDATTSTVSQGKVNIVEEQDETVSLDQSELKSLSLKNKVKYVTKRLKFIEENYVSKEQMMKIIQALMEGK